MNEPSAISAEPIVFAVAPSPARSPEPVPGRPAALAAFRTDARALAGMQKEAVVGPLEGHGRAWRMFCDEGPYLNGTDLAPFPLGYFAAGLQFSFLEALARLARARGIEFRSLESVQDTWYTMTGSALRGDMIGGAKPVDVRVGIGTDAPSDAVAALVRDAERACPAHAAMRDLLQNTFSCRLNAAAVRVSGVLASPAREISDPAVSFENLRPDPAQDLSQPLVSKIAEVKKVHGVAGGVSTSLQSEQKRTLNVHAEARLSAGGLIESHIQLRSPRGSTFRFLGQLDPAEGCARRAPSGLAYLSAGVAFCFLTQLGRYAHIVKCPVRAYRLAQFTRFCESDPAAAEPVDTHLFLEGDLPAEAAAQSLRMSERTCFLHAAMRAVYPSRIAVERNGQAL